MQSNSFIVITQSIFALVSVFFRAPKEDVHLHPELEFWTLLKIITMKNVYVLDISYGRKNHHFGINRNAACSASLQQNKKLRKLLDGVQQFWKYLVKSYSNLL